MICDCPSQDNFQCLWKHFWNNERQIWRFDLNVVHEQSKKRWPQNHKLINVLACSLLSHTQLAYFLQHNNIPEILLVFTQFSLLGCNTLLSNTTIVSPKYLLWFTSILLLYNWGSVKVRFRQATWPWNNDIRWSGHKWHKEQSQIQKWISDRDKKRKNKWFQNEWFCNSDYCQMPPENLHENLVPPPTYLSFHLILRS